MADEIETDIVVDAAAPATEVASNPSEARAALEASVAERLAATFAEEGDEAVVVEDATPAAEEEVEVGTNETDAEAAVVEKPEAIKKTVAAVADPNTPTLPAAYLRSLKAYEWTDEEIAAGLKAGGQNFIATAGKLHATRSKEVAQWAELGRQKTPAAASTDGTQTVTPAGVLAPLDVAALKKKYGNEAIIDDLVGPLNAVMKQINEILPQVQQTQQASKDAQAETLGKQIDSFFSSTDMTGHTTLYGTETGKLTNEQLASRKDVLIFADALIGGAKLQGRNLGLNEALQLAVDAKTSGTKEQAARQTISKALVKRQAAITLKPQARGPGAGMKTGPAKTRAEMEAKVARGLAAAFA